MAFDQALAESRFRIPEYVVCRDFGAETVALNLRTGQYFGLNITAGQILRALGRGERIADAVELIAREYNSELETLQQDVQTLCQSLLERELLQVVVEPV